MEGIVAKSTGSWYSVRLSNGQYLDCRLRGQFRIKGIKSTNPVAVGDHVEVSISNENGDGIITSISDRKNHVIRKATNLSKQTHIIAANIDQGILIATLAQPRTSMGFIDRFLCTCEAYEVPASLVFNKLDLYDETQLQQLDAYIKLYEEVGYPCFKVSALQPETLDGLKEHMKDKVSLVSGHSGVGKSSLINAIDNRLDLRVGNISDYHEKGKHTTTFAEMFELSFGGFIIDTPGIKEFGLVDIQPEEVSHYFPEMLSRLNGCKYYNCTHVNEPGCAVKQALHDGEIAISRYESYLSILDTI